MQLLPPQGAALGQPAQVEAEVVVIRRQRHQLIRLGMLPFPFYGFHSPTNTGLGFKDTGSTS